jgi:hypothetical protein
MDDVPGNDDDAGGAARAFEDLRAEMSVLRRAVEALPAAWTENQPPDYTPDLARVNKVLANVTTSLAAIEKHPALRLTPQQHQAEIAAAGNTLMREAAQKLDRCTQDTERERRQLTTLIGTVREKRRQLFLLIGIPLLVFVVTLVGSPVLLGELPFGLNTRAAAVTMQTDRWHAGWALMHAADPVRWEKAVAGFNLVAGNQATLTACWTAANTEDKDQRCVITVKAE